jgi:FtsH-binding integral membrane protein
MPARRGTTLFLVWPAILALTPKCPLCFFMILGASGAAGAAAAAWMPAAMIVSLAVSVIAVFLRSRMERRYGPAVVALIAAVTIVTGKFVIQSSAAVYAGAAALFIAAIFHFALEKIRWHKPLVW